MGGWYLLNNWGIGIDALGYGVVRKGWWVKDRKGSAVDGGVCLWSLGNGIGVWGGKAKELDLVWRKLSEESYSKWILENDCGEWLWREEI